MNHLASDKKPMKNLTDQSKYPGVFIFSHENMNGAVTLGNVIFTNPRMEYADILDHEYGHYLDYKFHFNYNTTSYLKTIGLPSILSATRATLSDYNHHNSSTEKRADILGGAWTGNKLYTP